MQIKKIGAYGCELVGVGDDVDVLLGDMSQSERRRQYRSVGS